MSCHVVSCHVTADESSQKWPTHTIVARSMRYDTIRCDAIRRYDGSDAVYGSYEVQCPALLCSVYCTVLYCTVLLRYAVCHSDTAIITASTSTSLAIS
jgi:hypothetical protein